MLTTQSEHASYDSAWKDILDHYLSQALFWCFPSLYKLIDWKKKYEPLDKELQSITKDGETGRQYVDKLMKVYLKNGAEQWILLLLEIQHNYDKD